MVSSTGKNFNQMGDYQYCRTQENFEYVTLTLRVNGFALGVIGICAPSKCSNQEDFSEIKRLMQELIPIGTTGNDLDVKVTMEVVSEINVKKIGVGASIYFSIVLILAIFGILGILVQYTKWGEIEKSKAEGADQVPIEQRRGKLHMFFYSFNPIVNLQKIFHVKEGGDRSLFVLNGVRVLSISWIVLGHSFNFSMYTPHYNFLTAGMLVKGHTISIVAGGLYAVDTFFFLSGFLTFNLLTLKAYKRRGNINWLLVYFHRYYRLVFPVVFVMFFAMYVFSYLGDGPMYKTGEDLLSLN